MLSPGIEEVEVMLRKRVVCYHAEVRLQDHGKHTGGVRRAERDRKVRRRLIGETRLVRRRSRTP